MDMRENRNSSFTQIPTMFEATFGNGPLVNNIN